MSAYEAALDLMVAGYVAGIKGSAQHLPECYDSKPLAWRHGWCNGRDDRMGLPRDRADVLRRRAEIILGSA